MRCTSKKSLDDWWLLSSTCTVSPNITVTLVLALTSVEAKALHS